MSNETETKKELSSIYFALYFNQKNIENIEFKDEKYNVENCYQNNIKVSNNNEYSLGIFCVKKKKISI